MHSNGELNIWRVQREWDGETVVILGGGPSLEQAQIDYIANDSKVIAVNDSYMLYADADILYACDAKWWKWHRGAPEYNGLKVGLRYCAATDALEGEWTEDLYPEIRSLIYEKPKDDEDGAGFSSVPGLIRSGKDSGYQAIQLAIQLGAARIMLLGFDMKSESVDLARDQIVAILEQILAPDYPPLKREAIAYAMKDIKVPHWHGHHPDNVGPPFDLMLKQYRNLNAIASELGVEIINCSPDTDLHEFWECDLEEVL